MKQKALKYLKGIELENSTHYLELDGSYVTLHELLANFAEEQVNCVQQPVRERQKAIKIKAIKYDYDASLNNTCTVMCQHRSKETGDVGVGSAVCFNCEHIVDSDPYNRYVFCSAPVEDAEK